MTEIVGTKPEKDLLASRVALQSKNRRTLSARSVVLYIPIVLPLVLVAFIIWLTFVRAPIVPVADEWEMTEFVQEFDSGTLGLGDLWQFRTNNEHRIVASRVIGLAIIELTSWNRQAHMVINLILTGLTAALLLQITYWTVASRALRFAATIPILVLCFSLARFANWFLPYTDKIPTILGIAVCAFALAMPQAGHFRFALAIVGAILASLSSSGGLIAWIVFAPAVLLLSRKTLAIWLTIGMGVIVPYLVGMQSGSLELARERGDSLFLPPLDALGYVLAYLGAPIGYPGRPSSQVLGIFGLTLVAANLAFLWFNSHPGPQERRIIAVWAGLAGFAFLTALAVMLGRGAAHGFGSSTTSRFIGLSSFLWISIVALGAVSFSKIFTSGPRCLLGQERTSRGLVALNIVGLTAITAGLLLSNITGFRHALGFLEPPQQNQNCILAFSTAPEECLAVFNWNGEFDPLLRTRSAYLAQRELSIFREAHLYATMALTSRPAEAEGGQYRCNRLGTGSNRDPALGLPAEIPRSVIDLLCASVVGRDEPANSRLAADEHVFGGACAVSNWDAYGERLTMADRQCCLHHQYAHGTLASVSLLGLDGQINIHAFADRTLDVIRSG